MRSMVERVRCRALAALARPSRPILQSLLAAPLSTTLRVVPLSRRERIAGIPSPPARYAAGRTLP